ncbi:MAG: FtsX-like permease family protein, partial [Dehalococcoidia bacterium]|nr:FtsX-like permease family protein [Dehalococcoidia bacterium]
MRNDPNIDGLTPILAEQVPVVDLQRRQSAPNARLLGLDETRLQAFPDLEDLSGNTLDPASLGDDEVFVNESLADELDTAAGSEVTVFYENEPITLQVAAIAKDRGITGSFGGKDNEGLVTRLSTLQSVLNRPDELNFIGVSNTGDLRAGVERTPAVEARLKRAFGALGLPLDVGFTKQEALDQAETAGAGMLTFFLVFGIFSIAAGMLLIVMIFVMLAAERKSELGMARALGTKRWHLIEIFLAEGMGYNLGSALVGAALGVGVAFALAGVLARLFASSDFAIAIEPSATPRSLIIAYALGVVLTFVTVAFSSWRVSRLNIVRAIRDLPEPEGQVGKRSLWLALGLGSLSALLMLAGIAGGIIFPFALGFSIACFAVALVTRFLGLPDRPVFTAAGLVLLGFWLVNAGGLIPGLSQLEGGIEMFILSGIVMVASASFVLVYNADLLLAVVSAAGGRLGRLLPAVRTAVAYPLASKFRTGMTLAMISLVVFALTMMSVMNSNFERIFLDKDSLGGWDVEVQENPSNALPGGLMTALEGSDPGVNTDTFSALGSLGVARPFASELCQPGASNCDDIEEFRVYVVKGADETFLNETSLPLQARATGFETDREVWDAIASDPNLAVIDSTALGGDFFAFGGDSDFFKLDGLEPDVKAFDPVNLILRDSASGDSGSVRVIGVLSLGASGGGDPFA